MIDTDRAALAVEYAQALAAAGFGIVEAYAPTDAGGCTCRAGAACDSPGKHPAGDDWQKRATRSPETIAQLVRARQGQYGVIPWPGERALILDVDHADRLPVPLPPSLRVWSRPGRGHAYFRLPAGFDARRLPATAPWGEIRVEGAARHVIGPYSRHASGAIYTPTGAPDTIAELPADVLAALFPPPPTTTVGGGPGYQLPELGYTGSRYEAIRDYIASRYHHRLTEAELWAGVREVLAPRLAEPLTETGPDSLRSRFDRAWRDTPARLGPPAGSVSVDERPNPSVNGRALAFRTGADLASAIPAEYEYVVAPWCAIGTLTELDGKPKVAGKTTLLLHLIRAVLDGAAFLGEPTRRSPVVLLTEQSARSIGPALRALALDRDELLLLTWPDALGTAWATIVAAATAECERIGARLLVIDTLGQFAGVRGDGENDAGAALEAMQPLQAAAAAGLAVLVSRHDRKAGGDVAESGRGSNAWSGAVDCVIALRRPLNPARATIRELEAISRRGDVAVEPILIELTDAGYVLLGSQSAVAFGESRDGILAALADGEWHVERELLEAMPDASRTTVRDALGVLVRERRVEKGSRARVTEPYPYRLVPVDGLSPSTDTLPADSPSSSSPSFDGLYTSVNGQGSLTRPPSEPDLTAEAERIFGEPPLKPWDASAVVPSRRADA